MASAARIFVAFSLAPLLPTLVLALALAREGQYLRVLALTAIVAYALTVALGVPVFLALRASEGGVTLRRVLVSSFLITAVPVAVLGLIAPASTAANPIWEIIGFPGVIGLLSLVGGAIFWHIAGAAVTVRQGYKGEV